MLMEGFASVRAIAVHDQRRYQWCSQEFVLGPIKGQTCKPKDSGQKVLFGCTLDALPAQKMRLLASYVQFSAIEENLAA